MITLKYSFEEWNINRQVINEVFPNLSHEPPNWLPRNHPPFVFCLENLFEPMGGAAPWWPAGVDIDCGPPIPTPPEIIKFININNFSLYCD